MIRIIKHGTITKQRCNICGCLFSYEREDVITERDEHMLHGFEEEYKYTQTVSIKRKSSGSHILQSYDPDLFDTKCIGNTCVGLTGYEMRLFIKKMKKVGLYSGKEKSCD